MDQLTALERELMQSVASLLSGTEADLASLRKSLSAFGTAQSEAIAQRLTTIEERQASIERLLSAVTKRMSSIEEQQKDSQSALLEALATYEQQLSASQKQLSAYGPAIEKLTALLSSARK